MFGEPEPKRGDTFRKTCAKCGDRFSRTEGYDENVNRCKECYEAFRELRDNNDLAAGTWTCRNDLIRNAVREFVENQFDIYTYVEGSKVYFFEDQE